ncbi:glycosyltransferase [Mesorhizobium koreense]|uniref:glycosyltransferase n=1 Tax=Mesorhizobium koreense TaxID=3074855 RepID=UPI00287BB689|nr:glycosyltransferase family 2 protein [Mesorhizobium sp. WR6]
MTADLQDMRGAGVRIDISVCTYRRPGLEDTLRSIGALNVPDGAVVRIVVADNDAVPSARDLVYRLASLLPFNISYLHCPASNISLARNACLDAATGDLLAFVDDDEMVSPDWLIELLRSAAETGADAVLGPVRAVYGDDAPRWMKRGDFHSTLPVWVRGEIRTGYTCNVLLHRSSPKLAGRRFNLALGRSGGEDTEYFARLHEAGGTVAFAPEAIVYEPVPVDRARFAWLAKRRFRMGQTHGRLLARNRSGAAMAREIGFAGAKTAYCLAAMALTVLSAEKRNRSLLRGIMHAGVVSGLLGVREIIQYGDQPVGAHGNVD